MNNSFILKDKNNNLEKTANVIVKFNYDEKDYLVYSIDENDQNCQIFVSRLILNSEGKYFIDNVMPEEKNKLSNIVYNIVILTPTDAKKGIDYDVLSKNLFDKFSVKLSSSINIMEIQEYYSNCSIAITNKLLAEAAFKFYEENLNKKEEAFVLPTWTAPIGVTLPTPVEVPEVNVSNNIETNTSNDMKVSDVDNKLNLESVSLVKDNLPKEELQKTPSNEESGLLTITPISAQEQNIPNPQAEKIAIISDPSLGLGINTPNRIDSNKAGFVTNKYVIIGTVGIVLAIVVVIVAFILISNIK